MEPIYLDYAATTPVRKEVREAMSRVDAERFGNPSSVHRWGREGRAALIPYTTAGFPSPDLGLDVQPLDDAP